MPRFWKNLFVPRATGRVASRRELAIALLLVAGAGGWALLRPSLTAIAALLVVAAAALTWHGVRIAGRVASLNEAAAAIRRGELDPRLPGRDGDALGRLAAHLDAIAGRLRCASSAKSELEKTNIAIRHANGELRREIEQRKEAERELVRRHTHDRLTRLPNLGLYRDRLSQIVSTTQRRREPCAVVVMDVNRFKDVNETFGQHVGDQVLQLLARRLHGVLRESDTLARIGGNQFAALLPATNGSGASGVAAKLLGALHAPLAVGEQTIYLRGCAGIAVYPKDGLDADALHQNAEVAMFDARRRGLDQQRWALGDGAVRGGRLGLLSDLRGALRRGGLELHYQPKLDLRTRQIGSAEVLLRWRHPRQGLVMPGAFIPLAERDGDLITALTVWSMHNALKQCRRWHDAGWPIEIAVNCAVSVLNKPEFPKLVADLLAGSGIPGESLVIEVTESVLMAEPDRALRVIHELTGLGVRFDIDDFGTGYSSLAYLKTLPVRAVKIDKAFVIDMLRDPSDTAIVRLIIDLARNLEIGVIAEGVEDEATLERLTELGCDTAQGFHIGRPVPARELSPLVVRREALRAVGSG